MPWIADFRDPWVDDPLRQQESLNWQERLKGKQESRVIKKADHVITTSKNFVLFLRKKYFDLEKEISAIYNGFDWDIGKDPLPEIQANFLEVFYAGAFYGSQSPIRFLDALESLIENHNIPIHKIRFTIVGGHGDKSWKERFLNSSIKGIINDSGFVPNSLVREKLMKAPCLVLFQARERGDLIVLGKTFEYISTGRPIFAIVPRETECLGILEQSGCLFKQADPDSEKEIREAILHIYESWKNGALKVEPNWKYISQFQGRNLTNSFAQILNKIY